MDTSTPLDLTKTKIEWDQYPALVLGLDGWLLRSLPGELRSQFLRGYEKLLRIIFHPDRYQLTQQKASREDYLQRVSEAIDFMLEGPMEYDLAADAVPARKNPLVYLQTAIDARDQIIARMDNDKHSERTELASLRRQTDGLRVEIARLNLLQEDQAKLNSVIAFIARRTFPIRFARIGLTGSFFDVSWLKSIKKPVNILDEFCRERALGIGNQWVENPSTWIVAARESGLIGQQETLEVKLGNCRYGAIKSAMTLPHLLACCGSLNNWKTMDQETISKMLLKIIENDGSNPDLNIKIHPYSLGFMAAGMILIMDGRAFAIESIVSEEDPIWEIVRKLKLENAEIISKNCADNRTLRERNAFLKRELEGVKVQLASLKKPKKRIKKP